MTTLFAIMLCVAVVVAQIFWTRYVCDVAESAAENLEARLPRLKWHSFERVREASGCPNLWLLVEVLNVLVADRVLDVRLAGVPNAKLLNPDAVNLFGFPYPPSRLEYRLNEEPRRRKRRRKRQAVSRRPSPAEVPLHI